ADRLFALKALCIQNLWRKNARPAAVIATFVAPRSCDACCAVAARENPTPGPPPSRKTKRGVHPAGRKTKRRVHLGAAGEPSARSTGAPGHRVIGIGAHG